MSRRPLRAADLLLVAAGGAAGAAARHSIDVAAGDTLFPWATLAINVVGAFALGVLPAVAALGRSHRWSLLLGPGLLGGFTTVSAWAGQVRELAAVDDGWVMAGFHLAVTLGAGLVAAAFGQRLAHRPEPEEATR